MSAVSDNTREFPAALFGPTVWAAHFMAVYAIEGFLCVTPTTAAMVPAIAVALTAVAFSALIGFMIWRWHRTRAVRASGSATAETANFAAPLAALSLLAVAWTALPIFTLPACTGPGS